MKKWMLMFLMAMQTASAADLNGILERGYLRVGVFDSAPHLSYLDAQGQYHGFDIEMSKALAKALFGDENKVEFILTESKNRIPYLKDDKVDVLMQHFSKTPERARLVDFAETYRQVDLGIITRKADAIDSIEKLQDKTVAVHRGTSTERFIEKKYPQIKLNPYPSIGEAYSALEFGGSDAFAGSSAYLWSWISEHPEFEVKVFLGKKSLIGPVVDKGNKKLLEWLNQEIKAMREDGRLRALYQQIMQPVYGDQVQEEQFLVL